MHVGLFTDSYLPRHSGVVQAVEAAGRYLRRRGHRVSIVAPAYPGYTDTDPDVVRLPSIAPPGHPDFPLAVPYSASHLRVLRGLRLDVVHTHSPFLLGGVGLWIARTLRLPVVFTYHTLYGEYAHYTPVLGDLTRPLINTYTTAYSNRCDVVLASVPSLAGLLRQYGIRVPIEVIPSVGVEPSEFAHGSPGDTRTRLEIPPGAPLLVCVSRLAHEKGLSLALEAFARLPARPPVPDRGRQGEAVWLLLIGDGPERETLRAQAGNLGIAGRVVFAGNQEHARVVEALFAADLFVFPSQTETMGLAVVEAMAAGRAVVATRSEVMADLVRDEETGLLTAANPGAFAGAIATLLADAGRRTSMGARGAQVASAYAQDRIIDRLAGVYEAVIRQRGVVASPR